MNSHENDVQLRLQAQAELAERQGRPAGGDPNLDRYRLVLRALRQPLAEQLPIDFARQVAARAALVEDGGSMDDWLVTLLMLGMAIAGVVYVQPAMASIVGHLNFTLPTLPWPLLGAAGASVALAWAIDASASGWHRHPH